MNRRRPTGDAAVVVVGSYNQDIGATLARFPRPGETVLGDALWRAHGGKGSNQAVQAARCGVTTRLLAAIGDDAAGEAARTLWREEGIGAVAAARSGAATGTALILVDAAGENQIVVIPGANATLSPEEVRATAGAFDDAALVVAQLETPPAATLEAFRLARAAGALALLNAAPAAGGMPAELLAATDLLVVNEVEAAMLAGAADPAAAESPAGWGRALRRAHPAMGVVVTGGARGAWLFAADADAAAPLVHAPAPRVAVLDATGAGDAFVGAFAARLAEGAPAAEALRFGVAAGSLACLRRGAVPSLPRRAEIEARLAQDGTTASTEDRRERP